MLSISSHYTFCFKSAQFCSKLIQSCSTQLFEQTVSGAGAAGGAGKFYDITRRLLFSQCMNLQIAQLKCIPPFHIKISMAHLLALRMHVFSFYPPPKKKRNHVPRHVAFQSQKNPSSKTLPPCPPPSTPKNLNCPHPPKKNHVKHLPTSSNKIFGLCF